MSFLLDTDVLSEPTRLQPSPKVDAWLAAHQSQSYTTAITIGELRRGIALLPPSNRRVRLQRWLEDVLVEMNGRILAYNTRVAETWGEMMAELERKGRTIPLADSLIAAIAKRHNLTVATRNTADFDRAGLRVVNPFV